MKLLGTENYSVLGQRLYVDKTELAIAVRYVDAKKGIFDKGIAYAVNGATFTPYIYFEKNRILDGNHRKIVDVSSFNYKYYGWMFEWPQKPQKRLDYFHIAYWRDGGRHTADSITVTWNQAKRLFEVRRFEMD